MLSNMKAELLLRERHVLGQDEFAELVVWKLSKPLPGSSHGFKYRLAYVSAGSCVLRYDNESGKGDHRHRGRREMPYRFSTPESLIEDFWRDVDRYRGEP